MARRVGNWTKKIAGPVRYPGAVADVPGTWRRAQKGDGTLEYEESRPRLGTSSKTPPAQPACRFRCQHRIKTGSGNDSFTVNYTDATVTTNLGTGAGYNTVNVKGTTGALYLYGGGSDSVTVGDHGFLAAIHGLVYALNSSGSTSLHVDDSTDTTGRTTTLDSGRLTFAGYAAPIEWAPYPGATGGVTYVAVYGGTGGNTFTVNNTDSLYWYAYLSSGAGNDTVKVYATSGALHVYGGPGNDSLAVVGTPSATAVAFDGGAGSNTVLGPSAADTWTISGTNAGSFGASTFSNVQNLIGGAATDMVLFSPAGQLSGMIDAQGGGDWLDYSPRATPVTVNLAAGTATGVTGGVHNIPNVLGSAGNDHLTGNALGNILIGGPGNDVLTAGSGRSLLIGGAGNDTVKGGAGDDLLIGGTTSFDTNEAALMSILAEWQSANPYATRISHLKNGGGLKARTGCSGARPCRMTPPSTA